MLYLKFIRKNNLLEFSDGTRLYFSIKSDSPVHYYATVYEKPFELLDVNKFDLSNKVLGYYIDGRFPYCKSESDVYKLLRALQRQSKINYFKENEL